MGVVRAGSACQLVVIPGQPVPFARPRPHFSKPGAFIHPKRYRDWLKHAKLFLARGKPLDGPVVVEVVGIFSRPKSWSKKRGYSLRWRDAYPDIDNIMKAALDAGSGLLYKDDKQVVRLTGTKLYGRNEECGLAIHVATAPLISLPWGLSFRTCGCWSRARFGGEGAEPHPTLENV